MIAPGWSTCHRHRAALLEFADSRDVAALDAAALDHLDRCSDCRREVEATALVVVALRRLAAEARSVEPPDESWARLRARATRRRAPWRWRVPMAGLLVSASLVAIILAPAAWLRPSAAYLQEAGLQTSIFDARRAAEDRSERAILAQQLITRSTLPADVDAGDPQVDPVDVSWPGPDGLRPDLAAASADAPVRVEPQ